LVNRLINKLVTN